MERKKPKRRPTAEQLERDRNQETQRHDDEAYRDRRWLSAEQLEALADMAQYNDQ